MQELPFGPLSRRTTHLCVDMQNLFSQGSPWHTPWMRRVLPKVEQLARHAPRATIFTRFMPPHRPDDSAGRWRQYFERWRELTRERNDPSLFELLPSLAELAPAATVVDKEAYSPFHCTNLADTLRERGTDALVVSGAETDVCVLAAVIAGIDHGFRVIVAADAICGSADETHDALAMVYRSRFRQQLEVAPTDAILAHWALDGEG